MLSRKWGHGHSIGTGLVFGAIFARRDLWLVAGLPFVAGLLLGRLWFYEAMFAEAMRRRVHHAYNVRQNRKRAEARAEKVAEQARLAQEIPY